MEHLNGWTRSDHYREAVRLHDQATQVGRTNEERGLGIMLSAIFHATLAANTDLARLQERANHLS